MRPKKVKPAIYGFKNDDLVVWQRAPRGEFKEASWGWVNIKELAEVMNESPSHVLDVYFYTKCGSLRRPYHRRISREGGPALAFATNLGNTLIDNLYEIRYYDWPALFNASSTHFRRDLLRDLLESDTFVPAGWAISAISDRVDLLHAALDNQIAP